MIGDTETAEEGNWREFEIAELVDGVSKLTQIKFRSRAEAPGREFPQDDVLAMTKATSGSSPVKLADRLHNIAPWVRGPNKARRIARETLDIYALLPIAWVSTVSPRLEAA